MVGVVSIKNKLRENRLRLFEHIFHRFADVIVKSDMNHDSSG